MDPALENMENTTKRPVYYTDMSSDVRFADPMFLASSTSSQEPGLTQDLLIRSPARSIPVDMTETSDQVEILADLPGVAKECIQVSIMNTQLTISVTESPQAHATSTPKVEGYERACSGTSQDVCTSLRASPRQSKLVRSIHSGMGDSCGTQSDESTHGVTERVGTSYWQPKRNIIHSERQPADHTSQRVLQLPADTDSSASQAVFADGVLRIVMPKRALPCFLNIS